MLPQEEETNIRIYSNRERGWGGEYPQPLTWLYRSSFQEPSEVRAYRHLKLKEAVDITREIAKIQKEQLETEKR